MNLITEHTAQDSLKRLLHKVNDGTKLTHYKENTQEFFVEDFKSTYSIKWGKSFKPPGI